MAISPRWFGPVGPTLWTCFGNQHLRLSPWEKWDFSSTMGKSHLIQPESGFHMFFFAWSYQQEHVTYLVVLCGFHIIEHSSIEHTMGIGPANCKPWASVRNITTWLVILWKFSPKTWDLSHKKQGVHQLFRCGFQPTVGRGDNVSNSYRDTVSDEMKPRPSELGQNEDIPQHTMDVRRCPLDS